jgi:hypothetical protein
VADLLLHFTPEVNQNLIEETPKEKEEEPSYDNKVPATKEPRPIMAGLAAHVTRLTPHGDIRSKATPEGFLKIRPNEIQE